MLLNIIVIRTCYIIDKRAEDHGHLCDLWPSRPDALPGVNHMRGMQYQIGLNIIFLPELNQYSCRNLCTQFLHKTATLIYTLNYPLVASYDIHGSREHGYET